MIDLIPKDNARLSTNAHSVLEALYDEFDRTGGPVDVEELRFKLGGVVKGVPAILSSSELAPYVRLDGSNALPTMRAAIHLWRTEDLTQLDALYETCARTYRPDRRKLTLPQTLARVQGKLAHLLVGRTFATTDASGLNVSVSGDVVDAATFAEWVQQHLGAQFEQPRAHAPSGLPRRETRITGIEVRGFRSFAAARVDGLGPLTVFAGPNEAGKTNLLRALRLLSLSAKDGISVAFDSEGGVRQAVRRSHTVTEVELKVEFEDVTTPRAFSYHVSQGRSGSLVERLDAHGPDEQLVRQDSTGRDVKPDAGPLEHPQPAANQSLLASLSDLSKFQTVISLRESIKAWRFYAFEPSALRSDLAGADGTLSADGRNLPGALNALGQHHPTEFKRLAEAFVDLLPEAMNFSTEVGLSGRPTLLLRERGLTDPFTQVEYSDGMLRILAILLLAFSPEKPTLVCIEEPENGLYPRLIESMLEALRMLSKDTQVFLTTHSVALLDRLSPEEVVFVSRDEGGTHLERLSDREDVKRLIKTLSLGSQLITGAIEDRP